MDVLDRLRLGEDQKVVVALQMACAGAEPLAAKMVLVEAEPLDLRAHGAVEDQNALARRRRERLRRVAWRSRAASNREFKFTRSFRQSYPRPDCALTYNNIKMSLCECNRNGGIKALANGPRSP